VKNERDVWGITKPRQRSLCRSIDLQGKHKWGMEVLDDQQFTAKIRDGYWVAIFVITLPTLFSPQFIWKDKE
jgi:hypothetical protein